MRPRTRRAFRDRRPRRINVPTLAALLFLIVLALIPAVAWARAGGGEGFHGGGFGGGHGGGGGGGGGAIIYLLFLLIQLCFQEPVVGIPCLLVFIAVLVLAARAGKGQYENNVITRGDRADLANDHRDALATLLEADPRFDADVFSTRVRGAFLRVQQAWSAQDLGAIRPFVSDGIVERFGLQFQEQRDAGYRNQMDRVEVLAVTLAQADCGAAFDEVTLRVSAEAADYHVRLQDGQYLSGDRSVTEFTEYWTFLRKHGGSSPAGGKPGLLEGHCPNCGMALTPAGAPAGAVAESAKCRSCGAVLRSGVYDWVLAKITQSSAWHQGAEANAAAIAQYRAEHDAGFCAEHVEDRASVIFWRWAKAQRLGQAGPLGKVAAAEFCDSFAADARSATGADGRRVYTGRCAVGAVDTLTVIPGPEWDQAAVRVEWSGTRLAAAPGAPGAAQSTVVDGGGYGVWILLLVRKSGVTSDPGMSLSSSHCPRCGAPQTDETADACAYCGAVLNDGGADWILRSMDGIDSARAQAILAGVSRYALNAAGPRGDLAPEPGEADQPLGSVPPGSQVGMLAWLAQVIAADGKASDEEVNLFQSMAALEQLPARQADAILAAAHAGGGQPIPQPANAAEARQWLQELALAIARKGRIPSEDTRVLSLAAAKLGLGDWDAKAVAAQVRARTLQMARQSLRLRRAGAGNTTA